MLFSYADRAWQTLLDELMHVALHMFMHVDLHLLGHDDFDKYVDAEWNACARAESKARVHTYLNAYVDAC